MIEYKYKWTFPFPCFMFCLVHEAMACGSRGDIHVDINTGKDILCIISGNNYFLLLT